MYRLTLRPIGYRGPHFHDRGNERALEMTREWLAGRGLCLISVPFLADDVIKALEFSGSMSPGIHHLVTGGGTFDAHHTVVCVDGQVVCDPSGSTLVGPCTDDGCWWVTFLGKKV